MSLTFWGASIGGLFAAGVLIVLLHAPPMRPVRLVARLAPYLGDVQSSDRIDDRATKTPLGGLTTFLSVVARDAASMVDSLLGGSESVRRRLAGLGATISTEEFRIEQVLWGALGGVFGGVGIGVASWLGGAMDPLAAGLACLIGVVGGVMARDYHLSAALAKRELAITAELPVIADLLALAVTAGEGPAAALERVCGLTRGELGSEIAAELADVKAGASLTRALTALAERATVDVARRFFEGFVVAVERGTPLAAVLRAQAADVHEMRKRELLAAGGRKEIAMMAPVVFLILPVTVVFALFPGLSVLTSFTN